MASLSLGDSSPAAPLRYLSFNQTQDCFSVGTDDGFRIYNCSPFRETFRREFSSGGIGMVEMLFRCNILALVGGGKNPLYRPHKVMIWDDHQNRCIGELSFRSDVRSVRLRRDRVVVALSNKVYVYNFADLKLLDHIETVDNPKGLCALCPAPGCLVLACPGAYKGHVRVELYNKRRITMIAAHEASLACIALNANGTRLATASEKGTLLRIYDTESGELLQELRRGSERAEILSIAFHPASTYLACTSDKGTVHIWKLRPEVAAASSSTAAGGSSSSGGSSASSSSSSSAAASNGIEKTGVSPATSLTSSTTGAGMYSGAGATAGAGSPAVTATTSLSSESTNAKESTGGGLTALSGMVKGLLPKYFSSEWSYAQFRVPETRTMVAFGPEPYTIIVVGADGSFFKANYEKGGEAVRVEYANFK